MSFPQHLTCQGWGSTICVLSVSSHPHQGLDFVCPTPTPTSWSGALHTVGAQSMCVACMTPAFLQKRKTRFRENSQPRSQGYRARPWHASRAPRDSAGGLERGCRGGPPFFDRETEAQAAARAEAAPGPRSRSRRPARGGLGGDPQASPGARPPPRRRARGPGGSSRWSRSLRAAEAAAAADVAAIRQ